MVSRFQHYKHRQKRKLSKWCVALARRSASEKEQSDLNKLSFTTISDVLKPFSIRQRRITRNIAPNHNVTVANRRQTGNAHSRQPKQAFGWRESLPVALAPFLRALGALGFARGSVQAWSRKMFFCVTAIAPWPSLWAIPRLWSRACFASFLLLLFLCLQCDQPAVCGGVVR